MSFKSEKLLVMFASQPRWWFVLNVNILRNRLKSVPSVSRSTNPKRLSSSLESGRDLLISSLFFSLMCLWQLSLEYYNLTAWLSIDPGACRDVRPDIIAPTE